MCILYIAAPVHPCTRGIPYILYIHPMCAPRQLFPTLFSVSVPDSTLPITSCNRISHIPVVVHSRQRPPRMEEVQILQDAYTDVSGRQRPELVVEQISAIKSM